MNRYSMTPLASLLAAAWLAGCAGSPRSVRTQDSTTSLRPLTSDRKYTGTLVARVNGSRRDLQYFVNGVRIATDDDVQWLKGERLELALSPGKYVVEARYRARRFAGDGVDGRIVTRGAVEVLPGRTTQLIADLHEDWRGLPEAQVNYFRVVEASTPEPSPAKRRASTEDVTAAAPSTYSSAHVPVDVQEPPPAAGETAAPAIASIVIHGNDVLTNGWSLEPGVPGSATAAAQAVQPDPGEQTVAGSPPAAPAQAGLPSPEPPQNENLPAALQPAVEDAAAPPTLEASHRARVVLLVLSEPSGASLTLDDNEVGRTPVRVRLDPSVDHVLQFGRPGCPSHVVLVSSRSWERGRSSTLSVQLECR